MGCNTILYTTYFIVCLMSVVNANCSRIYETTLSTIRAFTECYETSEQYKCMLGKGECDWSKPNEGFLGLTNCTEKTYNDLLEQSEFGSCGRSEESYCNTPLAELVSDICTNPETCPSEDDTDGLDILISCYKLGTATMDELVSCMKDSKQCIADATIQQFSDCSTMQLHQALKYSNFRCSEVLENTEFEEHCDLSVQDVLKVSCGIPLENPWVVNWFGIEIPVAVLIGAGSGILILCSCCCAIQMRRHSGGAKRKSKKKQKKKLLDEEENTPIALEEGVTHKGGLLRRLSGLNRMSVNRFFKSPQQKGGVMAYGVSPPPIPPSRGGNTQTKPTASIPQSASPPSSTSNAHTSGPPQPPKVPGFMSGPPRPNMAAMLSGGSSSGKSMLSPPSIPASRGGASGAPRGRPSPQKNASPPRGPPASRGPPAPRGPPVSRAQPKVGGGPSAGGGRGDLLAQIRAMKKD